MTALTKEQALKALNDLSHGTNEYANAESLRTHLSALHDEIDRLQSAHDAEVGALREAVMFQEGARSNAEVALAVAESRLREAPVAVVTICCGHFTIDEIVSGGPADIADLVGKRVRIVGDRAMEADSD